MVKSSRRVSIFACAMVFGAMAGVWGCQSSSASATNEPKSSPTPLPIAEPPAVVNLAGEETPWRNVVASDRATVIVFATTWCRVCQRERPRVEAWARTHANDARVALVITGSDAGTATEYVAEQKVATDAIAVFADPKGALARHFAIKSTPTLIHILADGSPAGTYRHVEDVPLLADVQPPAEPPTERDAGPTWIAVSDEGRELGTSYSVLVFTDDPERAQADLREARELCHRLEAVFSEWRADSEISRINREAARAPVKISPAMRQLIDGSLHVSTATNGAFDITWAPLGEVWDAAAVADEWPTAETITETLARVNWRHIRLGDDEISFARDGVKMGIAGVAKGWIIDSIFLFLQERGHENLTVNIGGDLRTAGRNGDGERVRVDIADPFRPRLSAGAILAENVAIATSGNYFRYREIGGKRVGHIIDPRTGLPPAFDGSVTLVTKDAAMADALATALFVMGPEKGLQFAARTDGVDVIFATRDGLKSTLPADVWVDPAVRERPGE